MANGWTTDKPTEPGTYYYRETPESPPRPTVVFASKYGDGEMCARIHTIDDDRIQAWYMPWVSELNGEWCKWELPE